MLKDFLSKTDVLVQAFLGSIMTSQAAEESQKTQGEAENLLKIVIAEDSPPNLRILSHLISKLNFEPVSFADGLGVWEYLGTCDIPKVGAIISDIMMPQMSGLELLEKVRADERFKHIPFVLVTAVAEKEYILEAMKHDVQGYILKPVTLQKIQDKLKQLFPNAKINIVGVK